MMLNTFYSMDALTEDVPSQSPVKIEHETILEDLLRHLAIKGDFLGVIDEFGTTLQVISEGKEQFWLEIPNREKGGSFGINVTKSDLEIYFQKIPKKISNSFLEGGSFVSWS